MSNYLDFSVQTREGFKDWILTMLGAPLITVELHDTQLDVCINNAVEEFTKYVSQEQEYLAVALDSYVADVGVELPDNVQGVFGLDDNIMGAGVDVLFSVPNQMYNAGIFPFYNGGSGSQGGGGWVTYELAMQSVDFAKRMMGGGYQFEYNPRNKILTLYPDPSKGGGASASFDNGWLALGVYTIRPDTMQFGESWVRRYGLAEAKIILGAVRGKFEGVQLLGGGTVDSSIRDQGVTERDQLMEELRVQEAGPYGFFVG